jgi:hypothetical protein
MWVREALHNTYSTDYLRKKSAGLFRPNALAVVDCDNLLGKAFLLDGVLWEVVEVDESTKLAKYTRAAADIDAEMDDASGAANMQVEDEKELEEATAAEATALLAIETSEVSVEELHALLGFTDQCDDMIVYSPDPNVRLIRNVGARKGVLWRGCGE